MRESTHKTDTSILKSLLQNFSYTFIDALRGVCSVGGSSCELFLVGLLSCGNVSLMNLPLVTNHPIMVRIAEGKKETINPPIWFGSPLKTISLI